MKELPLLEGNAVPFLPKRSSIARSAPAARFGRPAAFCPYPSSLLHNHQRCRARRVALNRSPTDVENLVRPQLGAGLASFSSPTIMLRVQEWDRPSTGDRYFVKERHPARPHESRSLRSVHKIPNFMEKASGAGRQQGLILDSRRQPGQSSGAKNGRNKINRISQVCCSPGRSRGILTIAGVYSGFPRTRRRHQARQSRSSGGMPIDLLKFFSA